MDSNRINEPSDRGVTSLEGLNTDFDGWVARFNSCYRRSSYFSKEISSKDDRKQNGNDIVEKDSFFGDLLLRHKQSQRSAKAPFSNFYKENEGFVFYDHVFYRLMNENGERRIVYQCIRSKL